MKGRATSLGAQASQRWASCSGAGGLKAKRGGLLPVHHPNRDFFLCDLFDYALKDDGVSMEAPIFTLATRPDVSVWQWESKDKTRSIMVTPSVLGRATQFDKDLLIYVVSQMTEALNRGRLDANSRTVRYPKAAMLAISGAGTRLIATGATISDGNRVAIQLK